MNCLQYKRYALVNSKNVIWHGLTKPTISSMFGAYTSLTGKGMQAALADGWKVKPVTLTIPV